MIDDTEDDDDNDSVPFSDEPHFDCDESDNEEGINDESHLVMKKPKDSAKKSIIILGNTFL